MFSLPKLLVLILLIAAGWYGVRWFQRFSAQQSGKVGRRGGNKATNARAEEIEDMVMCSVCETYLPSGKHQACDRPDCPYARS